MFEIYGGPLVGVRTYSNSCLPLQKRNYTYDSDEDNIPDTNHSELVPEEDTPPVNPLPQVERFYLHIFLSIYPSSWTPLTSPIHLYTSLPSWRRSSRFDMLHSSAHLSHPSTSTL